MKSFLLFSLLINSIFVQSTGSIIRIEFSSLTRGYQELIFITEDSIRISTQGRTKENKSIENQDWANIIKELKNVKQTDIHLFNSPTTKHAHNTSHHSSITIITKSFHSHHTSQ